MRPMHPAKVIAQYMSTVALFVHARDDLRVMALPANASVLATRRLQAVKTQRCIGANRHAFQLLQSSAIVILIPILAVVVVTWIGLSAVELWQLQLIQSCKKIFESCRSWPDFSLSYQVQMNADHPVIIPTKHWWIL